MPKKLTQEDFEKRVYNAVGDRISVLGQYQGKDKKVLFHCNIHNLDFELSAECFMRGPKDVRGNCPQCSQEEKDSKKTTAVCAYCKKIFYIAPSKKEASKSGLHFCCREHKDLAQRLDSGKEFEAMRPDHYGNGERNYRVKALREYEPKCAVCQFDEDIDVLEVHHIDGDRMNNSLENLIVLCPLCHKKLTTGKYQLINRERIEKIDLDKS